MIYKQLPGLGPLLGEIMMRKKKSQMGEIIEGEINEELTIIWVTLR
jgi:hypothetical protein